MRFAILASLSLLVVGCTPETPEPAQEPASVPTSDPASESASESDLVRNQPSRKTDNESNVREINQLSTRVVEALRTEDVAALKRIVGKDFDAETCVRRWHYSIVDEGKLEPLDYQFRGKRNVSALYMLSPSPHRLHVDYFRVDGEWKLIRVSVAGW